MPSFSRALVEQPYELSGSLARVVAAGREARERAGPPRTRAHAPRPQSGSRSRPAPRLIARCSAAQRGATRLPFCSRAVGAGESWAWGPEESSAGKLRAGLERWQRLQCSAFKASLFI